MKRDAKCESQPIGFRPPDNSPSRWHWNTGYPGIANTFLLFSDNVGMIFIPHFYYNPAIWNCQYRVSGKLLVCNGFILYVFNYKAKNYAVYRKYMLTIWNKSDIIVLM